MTGHTFRQRLRTTTCALALLLTSAAAFAETVRVTVDSASVWANPTGTAGVIGIVRRGTVLDVQGHEGRWLIVLLPADPRQRGYILEQQTQPAPGATPSAEPVAAQRPGRRPRPAATRTRTPASAPFLFVGVTGQVTALDFNATDSVQTLLETETRDTRYVPSRRPGFDIGIGREFGRRLVVSGALVRLSGPGTASITASIPHPFFYGQPRALSGESTAERVETAVHLQLGRVVHRGRRVNVTLGAGPTYFVVRQDLLTALKYDETYPFDTVTFTGATFDRRTSKAFGVNGAVDIFGPITRRASWQVTARVSHGSADFTNGTTTTKASAGHGQVSGGIRLGF